MPDVVSPQKRSQMMSGIGGKNTKPEAAVRAALTRLGYRYRLHRRDLAGTPDIAMPGRKIAIFAHGCFWHMHQGCRFAKVPSTRTLFWREKLEGNAARDRASLVKLQDAGWRVLWVWECAVRDSGTRGKLPRLLRSWIEGPRRFREIAGPRAGAKEHRAG